MRFTIDLLEAASLEAFHLAYVGGDQSDWKAEFAQRLRTSAAGGGVTLNLLTQHYRYEHAPPPQPPAAPHVTPLPPPPPSCFTDGALISDVFDEVSDYPCEVELES